MVEKALAFALLFALLGSLMLVALFLQQHLLFNALILARCVWVDNLNSVDLAQSHVPEHQLLVCLRLHREAKLHLLIARPRLKPKLETDVQESRRQLHRLLRKHCRHVALPLDRDG